MKEVDIISKVVGRDTSGKTAMYIPGAGAPSVDLDDYLMKKIWDSVFEVRTDGEGNPYLFEKMPFVTQYGITMYADGGDLDLPGIYAGLPIDNQTLYWENGVLKAKGGTEGAITSITSTMIVDALGYIPANGSDVTALQNKVNDFLSGSDTDTIINKWKELEAFLSGLNESDNLATILSDKADKATTLAGYGITDAYTKTKVDEMLGNYVTLASSQTISGEKNFTGGLKVNGSPIVYDATNKYWKLEGDLLVTGGVTMYASDSSFTPSTIMDAIATDNVNLKVVDGVLTFVGQIGGGVADSVLWDNVVGKPSWIGSSKPSYSYSEISGTPTLLSSFHNDLEFVSKGTTLSHYGITNAIGYSGSIIANKADAYNLAGYGTTGGGFPVNGGAIKVGTNNYQMILHGRQDTLRFNTVEAGTLKTWRKVWHDGNFNPSDYLLASNYTASDILAKLKTVDGASSGLDADLLDGTHKSGLLTAASSSSATNLSITVGGTTKKITDLYAYKTTQLETARTIWGQSFDGTANVSGALSGATTGAFSSNVTIGGTLGVTGATTLKSTLSVASDTTLATKLTLNGIPIYKSQDDVLYIDGNLAVRGGITMYATDAIDVPSIIEALPPASSSVKGIAAFNPNDFSVVDGYVSFIGSSGVDESVLADYAKKTDLSAYLPLRGGTISNDGYGLILNRESTNPSWLQFKVQSSHVGAIGAQNGNPIWMDKSSNQYTILHSGNWSQFVTAGDGGNYLPLSGGTLNGTLSIGTTISSDVGRATLGLVSVGDNPTDFKMGNGSHVWSITARNNAGRKNMWFYSYVSNNILIELDATFNAVRIGRGTDSLTDYLDPEYSLDVVGPLRSNRGVFKSSSANILSLYRTSAGGGAWIDYYASNQSSSKWRVGTGGGLNEFTWEAPDGNYPCRIIYDKTYGIRFEIGQNFLLTSSQSDPSRATLTLISKTDVPTDLIMGANAYDWSITARGSSDDYFLGFYSNRNNQYVTRMYRNGNVLVTGGITMYSDIRKKTKLQDVELSLKQIADAPLIEHYYNSDTMRTTHVGSIAQYWASMNDWFCKLDNDGYYTMEIQNAALASAISIARELSRYETKTDRKIRLLKQRVKELEDKIEKLENN